MEDPLPLRDLHRMDPILRGQFVYGLLTSNRGEGHFRFKLTAMLPTLATHSLAFYPCALPTVVNLFSGPVFGVHYTETEVKDMLEAMSELPQYAGRTLQKGQ